MHRPLRGASEGGTLAARMVTEIRVQGRLNNSPTERVSQIVEPEPVVHRLVSCVCGRSESQQFRLLSRRMRRGRREGQRQEQVPALGAVLCGELLEPFEVDIP